MPSLQRAFFSLKFITLDEVDSTNAEARRIAEKGEYGPLWVKANSQTGGRGRRGREWVSNTGNLYCSGLYPHQGSAHDAAKLSFAAALAVAETLRTYVPENLINLKWPNDVLVDGKKISGILLEGGQDWIVVGIGVNLVSHPEHTETAATHLLDHIEPSLLNGPEPILTGPDTVLATLSSRFSYWRDMFLEQGFSPIRQAWLGWAQNIPGSVIVRLSNEKFSGQALGLDENGALRVRLENGTIKDVHAGDVFFGNQGA